jgi:hypothetical protein
MVFSFGRKAKFEKLVQELKVLVLSQPIGFAAMVAEEIEGLAAKGSYFSAKPHAYHRLFSSVGSPKSDTTLINQMTLFLGAFSFFWHAIDRYSFRPNNEALRAAILEPIVFGISKGLAEMMSSKGTKTITEEIMASVQPLSLRYAGAPTLLGTNPSDVNSALWLAGVAIVTDTDLPSRVSRELRDLIRRGPAARFPKRETPRRVDWIARAQCRIWRAYQERAPLRGYDPRSFLTRRRDQTLTKAAELFRTFTLAHRQELFQRLGLP